MAKEKKYQLFEDDTYVGEYNTTDLKKLFNVSSNTLTCWARKKIFRKKYSLQEVEEKKKGCNDSWVPTFCQEWNNVTAQFHKI